MERLAFEQLFEEIFFQNGMEKYVNPKTVDQCYRLTERLLEVNAHMNLTAITDPAAVILRHYVDSMTVSSYLPADSRVVDIGCGAGFPTLPLAIIRPDLRILALDSTAKRIQYVADTAQLLGLTNVESVSCRAEDGAGADGIYREKFDCVISRAVANLPVLCELCLPYLRVGGRFVAMKAAQAMQETDLARNAITKLGGSLVETVSMELIGGDGREERNLILVEKIGKTPKNYPRNFAQIKKKPL